MSNQPEQSQPPKPDKRLFAKRSEREELPPDADLEDRFNDFWKRNGPAIFLAIAVIAIVVTGYQTIEYFGERREAAVRSEFGEVMGDPAALVSFAQEHEGRSIGGMAYLMLANDEYAQARYRAAADHYHKAAEALVETPIVGRARLGAAMSLMKLGQFAEGEAILQDLAGNQAIPGVVRAEAAYNLGVAYWERENYEALSEQLDFIEDMEESGYWGFRAMQLRERIPQLREFASGA